MNRAYLPATRLIAKGTCSTLVLCRKPRLILEEIKAIRSVAPVHLGSVAGPLHRADMDRLLSRNRDAVARIVYWCEYSAEDLLCLASVARGGSGRNFLSPVPLYVVSAPLFALGAEAMRRSDMFFVRRPMKGSIACRLNIQMKTARGELADLVDLRAVDMVIQGMELHLEAISGAECFEGLWRACVDQMTEYALVPPVVAQH